MGLLFSCFKPFSCPSVLNTIYISPSVCPTTVRVNPLFLKQYLKMFASYHCSLKVIKCPICQHTLDMPRLLTIFFSCNKNYFPPSVQNRNRTWRN